MKQSTEAKGSDELKYGHKNEHAWHISLNVSTRCKAVGLGRRKKAVGDVGISPKKIFVGKNWYPPDWG